MTRSLNSAAVGAVVRQARLAAGITQTELGQRIGASRFRVAAFEKGKPSAELGLALKALHALELEIRIEPEGVAVGGERAVESITGDHWRAVARAVDLPADALIDRIAELGQRIPAAIERVIAGPGGDDETRAIVMRLTERIVARAEPCLRRLQACPRRGRDLLIIKDPSFRSPLPTHARLTDVPLMKRGLTFDDVQALAARLPGVERSTSYGTPALKMRGKLLVRLKEDGESMVIRVPFVVRNHLLASDPACFYVTDHYAGYPAVLARLPRAERAVIDQLIEDAWRAAAPKKLRDALGPAEDARPG